MSEAPPGSPLAGMAAGCGLLLGLHAASYAVVFALAALSGLPTGDFGLPMFAVGVYSLLFPVVQIFYAGLAAGIAAATGRRPLALGVVAGSAVTLVLSGTCAAWFGWSLMNTSHF